MTLPTGLLPGVLLGLAVLVARGLPRAGSLRVAGLVRAYDPAPRSPSVGRAPELVSVLLGLVLGGPVLAALAPALVLGGRRLLRRRAAAGGRALEQRRAVEALTALAGELRAGRAPEHALAAAAAVACGPFQRALSAARSAAGVGGDVPGALLGVLEPHHAARSAVPDALRGLAACWQVCSRSGGSLAPAVERLALGLRDRQVQQQAVASELAGPQATAAVLAVLPLGGVALAASLGADPVHVLLRTPLGLACLLLGATLDGLGLWWTSRLVARAAGT